MLWISQFLLVNILIHAGEGCRVEDEKQVRLTEKYDFDLNSFFKALLCSGPPARGMGRWLEDAVPLAEGELADAAAPQVGARCPSV